MKFENYKFNCPEFPDSSNRMDWYNDRVRQLSNSTIKKYLIVQIDGDSDE